MIRTNEDGFTIIELMAALSILAIGFFSLAAAMGLGLRQVALGRQRQSATEIANGRLEHLRNIAYTGVDLSTTPAHSSDPTDPDYYVDNAQTFDYDGKGHREPLIVDTTNGQVLHFEDPVTVGATQMKVYQYVTWVDDPAVTGTQDYKRITVVVVFKTPSVNGVARVVRASSFVSTGKVIVAGSGTSPTQGSPTPSSSPSPSPSPSASGPCAGDVTAPSGDFSIVSGASADTGYTASTSVTLSTNLTDPCATITAAFSNDGATFGTPVSITAAGQTLSWTIPAGNGTKQVWGKFTDGVGNNKTTGPYSIVLDQTTPTTPGTLTATRSCSGSTRTVNLSWGISTDTNLHGYRVYRSVNNGAWAVVATVSTTSASDSHSKTLDSVAFRVTAYDKAGNETVATNTVTLSKNQC